MAPFDPAESTRRRDRSCRTARQPALLARVVLKAIAAFALAAGLAACGDSEADRPQAAKSTTEATEATATTSTPRADAEPLEVDLRVVSGSGGTFAFANVFINGKGPFAFTVDTGASRSVLDWEVVKRVGIDVIGEPVEITGITCRGEAGRIRVRGWRVGDVRLPRAQIQTVDMPEPPDGTAIDGLLGSDILSRFGAVTVDYTAERLLLRERSGA
jgi:predicted aspartyl protease